MQARTKSKLKLQLPEGIFRGVQEYYLYIKVEEANVLAHQHHGCID